MIPWIWGAGRINSAPAHISDAASLTTGGVAIGAYASADNHRRVPLFVRHSHFL